jgi:uncharacterized protein
MFSIRTSLRAAAVAAVLLACAGMSPAAADEIKPSQLAAALDAITATGISQNFDSILPHVARQVEDSLTRVRPDLYKQISQTVEATALKLADRKGDLNNDIARVWAKAYTEDELKTITAFFKTSAGQKFLTQGTQVSKDTAAAANQWANRVGSELLDKSREAFKAQGVTF